MKGPLSSRRTKSTITVYNRTRSGSQYSDNVIDSGLSGRKEASFSQEIVTEAGAVVLVSDVFWFDKKSDGTLPAIEEKHILYDGTSRYEVMMVIPRLYANKLKVMTRVDR